MKQVTKAETKSIEFSATKKQLLKKSESMRMHATNSEKMQSINRSYGFKRGKAFLTVTEHYATSEGHIAAKTQSKMLLWITLAAKTLQLKFNSIVNTDPSNARVVCSARRQ